MPFKINLSGKDGKTWKIESESPGLIGKSLGETVKGSEISPDLEGYEFTIMGGSDKSGFAMYEKLEGIGIKKVLLTQGWGMHKRPKGDKKKRSTPEGLRLRKTVRGKTISEVIVQINLKITKEGSKKLAEVFPEQNKAPEPEVKEESPKTEVPAAETPTEAPTEEKPVEAPAA